jgi:hypothetical protein
VSVVNILLLDNFFSLIELARTGEKEMRVGRVCLVAVSGNIWHFRWYRADSTIKSVLSRVVDPD